MEVVLRGRGQRLEAASLDSHRRSCGGDVGAGGVQGTREGPESGPCSQGLGRVFHLIVPLTVWDGLLGPLYG